MDAVSSGAHSLRSNVIRGAAFMALSSLCLALDAGLIRMTSRTVHPFQIAFFRSLFSLVFMLPWLIPAGRTWVVTSRLPMHLLRAVLKLVSLCSLFFAIKYLPLADVTAITFTAPFFVAFGAGIILGERLRPAAWGAICVGFLGVLVVLRPGAGVLDPMILVALLSAACSASIIIVLKLLTPTEPPVRLVGLNLLLSVGLALLVSVPVWIWPDPTTLALLAAQGALGLVSQSAIVKAMGLADASSVMPLEFIRLPFVIAIAWMAFGEAAELATVVGGAVIFASSFWLVRVSSGGAPVLADP